MQVQMSMTEYLDLDSRKESLSSIRILIRCLMDHCKIKTYEVNGDKLSEHGEDFKEVIEIDDIESIKPILIKLIKKHKDMNWYPS